MYSGLNAFDDAIVQIAAVHLHRLDELNVIGEVGDVVDCVAERSVRLEPGSTAGAQIDQVIISAGRLGVRAEVQVEADYEHIPGDVHNLPEQIDRDVAGPVLVTTEYADDHHKDGKEVY